MSRLRAAGALALALAAVPLTAAGAPPAAAVVPPPGARSAAAFAAPAGPVHRVRPGECLSVIAQRYGVALADLVRANRIADPDLIRVGRELQIPLPARSAGADRANLIPGAAGAGGAAAAAGPAAAPAAHPAAAPAAVPAMAAADLHVYYAAARPAERPAPVRGRPRVTLRPAPLVAVEGVEEPTVALTFNGAPGPADLPAVLTVLDRYRMSATFFVDPAAAPALAARLASFGHEVGSYGLPPVEWQGSRWIRPLQGVWQGEDLAAARRRGLAPVLWSSIGLRDRPGTTPEQLAVQAEGSLFPGAVLMLHADRAETVAALPGVFRAIHAAGYTARSLSEVVELASVAFPRVE